MDGRVYNYNAGPWNPCNENFQAACLELQNSGIPNSRDGHGMVRDPSKAMASAPSFMFLNYPAEDHIHTSNQHAMHRAAAAAQWQIPQWPKVKAHTSHGHKNFGMMKDDWSGMATNMHHGHSALFNIPPPGPFCTSDISEALQDNCVNTHQQQSSTHQQQSPVVSYASQGTSTIGTPQLVQSSAPPQRKPAVKKSNPKPRKKREKKTTADKEKKKRTRNEESWARNKRKKARARGESYMSVVGKMMRAKEVQPVDCSKCKFHCPDQVTEEDRQKLFHQYWSLESFKDKVNFLSDCVEEFVPLRPISGKRLYSRRYKLKIGEGDDEKIARVCKEFFISTFDISESTIVTFMNKKRKNPEEIKDNRGHQIPSNKTPPEVVQSIREHILSQTGLQGCLTKFNLEEVKNIKRLYTHYQAECEADEKKPASMSVYRKVYGDMHKDKTEAPVILPPEDVLDQISPLKKQKLLKAETPSPLLPQSDENVDLEEDENDYGDGDDDNDVDDDDDVGESLPVEPLNLTPPSLDQQPPPRQQMQQVQPLPSQSQPHQQTSPSSCSLVSQSGASPNEMVMSTNHQTPSQQPQQQQQHHNQTNHSHQNHHNHPNHHLNHNQIARQMMVVDKSYNLNIPMSSSTSAHSQNILDNSTVTIDNGIMAPSFDTTGSHLNQLMPLMWGQHHRMAQQTNGNQAAEMAANIRNMQSSFVTGPTAFPNQNPNPMHHVSQSCLFSNPNTISGSTLSSLSSNSMATGNPTNQMAYNISAFPSMALPDLSLSLPTIRGDEEVVVVKKLKKKPSKPRVRSKPKKEPKKRTRNEESWGRNIRKRLRFKGEEYISVKGKTVGAKKVQMVDCSKCKYKCETKITEEQRLDMNEKYWKLENYQKRIEFISKYVQTYVPKRKMTGRRAYSRNYTFIVGGKHVRVCKNFFISTLHISESIVATCLKKARKGPSASKDMRGKHKPVNKTSEEVLKSIRELIIYLTGVRPRRLGRGADKSSKAVPQYQDINRLYLIYKYDSEKKGKKTASHGIFRNVLLNEFGFTGNSKFKKSIINKMNAANSTSAPNKKEMKLEKSATLSTEYVPTTNAIKPHNSISLTKSLSSLSSSQPVLPVGNTPQPPVSKQPEVVELSEGSSTHPVFSTCLLSSF